jgi:hypothetical protein
MLIAAATLFVLALPVLVYVLVTAKTFNLQQVWSLAVSGNRAARLYMALILLAFAVAVLANITALFQKS